MLEKGLKCAFGEHHIEIVRLKYPCRLLSVRCAKGREKFRSVKCPQNKQHLALSGGIYAPSATENWQQYKGKATNDKVKMQAERLEKENADK
ncbi:MAG: hypothetical protein QM642_00285 [Edaphocola sp.]